MLKEIIALKIMKHCIPHRKCAKNTNYKKRNKKKVAQIHREKYLAIFLG